MNRRKLLTFLGFAPIAVVARESLGARVTGEQVERIQRQYRDLQQATTGPDYTAAIQAAIDSALRPTRMIVRIGLLSEVTSPMRSQS